MEYMSGKDVFVSLGSGKSLCHYIIHYALDSVRSSFCSQSIVLVVVSPLIAYKHAQEYFFTLYVIKRHKASQNVP